MFDNFDALIKLSNSERFTLLYFRGFDASSSSEEETRSTYLSYHTKKLREAGPTSYAIDFDMTQDPSPWLVKFTFEEKGRFVLPSIKLIDQPPHHIDTLSEHLLMKVGLDDVLKAVWNDVSLLDARQYFMDIANKYNSILQGFKQEGR